MGRNSTPLRRLFGQSNSKVEVIETVSSFELAVSLYRVASLGNNHGVVASVVFSARAGFPIPATIASAE